MTDLERKKADEISAVWLSHPFLEKYRKSGAETWKKITAEREGKEMKWQKGK